MDGSFYIRLDEFEDNAKSSWQQLQTEKHSSDVTLACENAQILAHKVILSSSSPFFKSILKQYSNQHSFIYITGVEPKCLQNLISYLYQGEVPVTEDELHTFLAVAEDLKIKGLSEESKINSNVKQNNEENQTNDKFSHKMMLHNKELEELTNDDLDEKKTINSFFGPLVKTLEKEIPSKRDIPKGNPIQIDKTEMQTNNTRSLELKTSNTRSLEMQTNNTRSLVSLNKSREFVCDICERQFIQKAHLIRHKGSIHEGVRYKCNECDVSVADLSSIKEHRESVHEGIRYPCNQCNITPYTSIKHLRHHKKSVHDGIRYPCDQCYNATFTSRSSLKHHKAAVHEGVRHSCNQCEKSFIRVTKLTQHKILKHEEVSYECKKCDYKTSDKTRFSNHNERNHKV